jgi:tripartite-type tricarboxylate transporter receptor subunit TctC
LPGFAASAWFALVAPPGTPVNIAADINKSVNEILKEPYVRAKIQSLGGEVVGGTPKDLGIFLDQERVRWKKVIDTANVTMD